ncbi:hypothetical protein WFC_00078 [Escherichia phage vB_EcoM_WFC]|jgi:hypothetical protein|uniref:Uncharacterized protein n=1 Tax=Escherichia phage vB_EcoM_WFC TaxID=2508193 RepID=A0A482MWK1_9CAUD|nr:hypothetical protein HOV52_gp078 [Escherichia phage vB_EcoM_WFC]QBQ77470.1 hypothetical protein WFC_00078 [Escherichia phage vB_EcoM_WFC]
MKAVKKYTLIISLVIILGLLYVLDMAYYLAGVSG